MAHVGTGSALRGSAPRYADAMRRPANPRAADGEAVEVRIPAGGSAHVSKLDNGVLVTTNDGRWNTVSQVYAPSADRIKMK